MPKTREKNQKIRNEISRNPESRAKGCHEKDLCAPVRILGVHALAHGGMRESELASEPEGGREGGRERELY